MQGRYETVLAALDAGVVVHAPDTAIIEANGKARELLGIRDIAGRLATDPAWTFLEPDGSPMPLTRFPVVQVLSDSRPVTDQIVVIQRPDGARVWVEVNARPLLNDSGELAEVIVTFIDITSEVRERQAADTLARELAELSVTDPLTGIANRRGIFQELVAQYAASVERGHDLAILIIDLDHFKSVNDTLGHVAGDEILVSTVGTISGALRTQDSIGRVGGEEFLVVLPSTGCPGAWVVAGRLRRAVDDEGSTTVSVGLACLEKRDTVDTLFRRADEALYRAKAEGRNRVIGAC